MIDWLMDVDGFWGGIYNIHIYIHMLFMCVYTYIYIYSPFFNSEVMTSSTLKSCSFPVSFEETVCCPSGGESACEKRHGSMDRWRCQGQV